MAQRALAGPVINRRLVTWDGDGNPVVTTHPLLTQAQVRDVVAASVSALYDDPLMLEPEYAGWTRMEVMLDKVARRAAETGDPALIKDIREQIIGKPKQSSEVVTTHVTYEDRLREIQRKERGVPVPVRPIIDVQAVPPYQGEDDPLA